MPKKIVDVVLWIDGLILKDEESVENIVNSIQSQLNTNYPIKWRVDYEEDVDNKI